MAAKSISFGNTNSGLQIGENYGSIGSIQFHHAPERPETPPDPDIFIPFRRDPDFVDRGTILDDIAERISAPASRVALVGLGGVGKSQLAIEFCHRVRSTSPNTWIFWVHASNAARFEQSFRQIADQVKIPGRGHPQSNIFQLVENWLQDTKHGKWVLVLDNVDDDSLLRIHQDQTQHHANTLTKPLLEFLPRNSNGSILITSRNNEVALKMLDHRDVIEIGPLDKSEALELLRRKIGVEKSSSGALEDAHAQTLELVEALDLMPLAIAQAAGYIAHYAPRCSISQYLAKIRQSDREAIKLLKYEAGHPRRDWDAKNSILLTWQISFDHIRESRESAADLLCLMSFFDRQGIPEVLLCRRDEQYTDDTTGNLAPDPSDDKTASNSDTDSIPDVNEDLRILRDYSFISTSEDGSTFSMHRLVQLAAHIWLKSQNKTEHHKAQFICTLFDTFPQYPSYENMDECRLLFPHIKSAVTQRPKADDLLELWADILCKGALHAQDAGYFLESKEMALQSKNQREKILGADHQETLYSASVLAQAYTLAGQWSEAENLQVQVLVICKSSLGENHPDTIRLMADLALIYSMQKRWADAAKLNIEVLDKAITHLGEDHSTVRSIMNNLTSDLRELNHLPMAQELGLFVLEKFRAKFGEDHPDTLVCKVNLALTYSWLDRWVEAEELQVEALETMRVRLGEDHPHTVETMGYLAITWKEMGKTGEALDSLRRCLVMAERVFGPEHPKFLEWSKYLLEWEAEVLGFDESPG